MPRLLRPPIPVEVKLRVLLRQLGEMWPGDVIRFHKEARSMGGAVADLKARLAETLNCEVKDLRLDHDPALGAREKVFRKRVHVDYIPSANDPAHLLYRPHGPQFVGSHLIKTNVRGEHGQHPDRVLIKKNRRLERAQGVSKLDSRKRRSKTTGFRSSSGKLKPKRQWPKGRKIQSRNDLRRRRP